MSHEDVIEKRRARIISTLTNELIDYFVGGLSSSVVEDIRGLESILKRYVSEGKIDKDCVIKSDDISVTEVYFKTKYGGNVTKASFVDELSP